MSSQGKLMTVPQPIEKGWTTLPSTSRDTTQIIDGLSLAPLFRGLERELLRKIASSATIRRFPQRTMLFLEGDPGDPFYILVDGPVKVFVTSRQGNERVLATLGPYDTLGDVSLLDEGGRSASAASIQQVTTIARSTLLQLIGHVPAIGDALRLGAANLIRRLTEQGADLVFLDLEGRVAKLLLATGSSEKRERKRRARFRSRFHAVGSRAHGLAGRVRA